MDNLSKQRLIRFAIIFIFGILLSMSLYLSFIYMYPFFIALLLSFFFHPFVSFIEKRWGWHRGLLTLTMMILFFIVFFLSMFLVLKQIIKELSYLLEKLPFYIENIDRLLHDIEHTYITPVYTYINKLIPDQLPDNFSMTRFLISKLKTNAIHITQETITISSDMISSFAYMSFISIFIVLATYFITKDYETFRISLRKKFPINVLNIIGRIKGYAKRSTFGFVKAQITVSFITASLSFCILLLFRTDHLIVITLMIFMIDFIPYLGIGILFIPWIMYEFFTNGYVLTIQLTLLYMFLIVVRQIIEPRLLAQSLGIHPLITIIILFICLHLFGAVGFLITPMTLIVVSSLYHAKIIHYIIQYIKHGHL